MSALWGGMLFFAAVFARLSARVGSIGDNRLGGWYAYRASRAARNLLGVIDDLEPEDNGGFFAWDGNAIPW